MLEIYFFNVGHGDSIIIKFPNGAWGVIDCHRNYEKRNPNVLKFLKEHLINNLSFICVTHPHSDHIRGLDILEREYKQKIDKFLIYGLSTGSPCEKHKDTPLMKTLLSFTNSGKDAKKLFIVNRGYREYFGDAELIVLNPSEEIRNKITLKQYAVEHLDFNEESVVILVKYAGKQILLTGDIPTAPWDIILNDYPDIKADIIKISHHGSKINNDSILLEKIIKPNAYAIISTDGGKKYATLPSEEVINYLRNTLNCTVLNTSELGIIADETQDIDLATNEIIDMISEKVVEPFYNGYFKLVVDENGHIE